MRLLTKLTPPTATPTHIQKRICMSGPQNKTTERKIMSGLIFSLILLTSLEIFKQVLIARDYDDKY